MARINIEDNIESQSQFHKLLKLVDKDRDRAIGLLVRFWQVAQYYWGRGKLVPLEEIELGDFQPLIESKWAIVQEAGVYAIRSEEMFDWYKQKYDASQKAKAIRDKKRSESESRTTETDIPIVPLAPAPVPTLVKKNKNKELKADSIESAPHDLILDPKEDKKSQDIGKFIAVYVKEYGIRYQRGEIHPRPSLDGKTLGQIKRYLADTPIDRACQAMAVYCQMKNKWFETKSHDFGTFLENLNNIYRALDTGSDPEEDKNRTNWDLVFGDE